MPRQNAKVKDTIIEVANRLFSEQGYRKTTVDQIIKEAGCSKGTFYYHFTGKAELSTALNQSMDTKFKGWYANLPKNISAIEQLMQLAEYIYDYTEKEFDAESFAATYAYYLSPKSDHTFDSPNREYNIILKDMIKNGQDKEEIRKDISFVELAKMYNIVLRGVMFDWCISQGLYSVKELGMRTIRMFIPKFAPD